MRAYYEGNGVTLYHGDCREVLAELDQAIVDAVITEDGQLRADVFEFRATASAYRDHPVEKPTAMLRWLMVPIVRPGGCVLDPFAGSGTTLEAARDVGCRAIGIEGEERYCEVAARRLQSSFAFEGAESV